MKKIAFFGECMVELGGQPFAGLKAAFGGDTLNTAIYFARLMKQQAHAYYVTALGRDGFSDAMLLAWRAEGLDTQLVAMDEARHPGIYSITVAANGERSFCYWRSDSAARYIFENANIAAIEQALMGCDAFYCSGISLAILKDRQRLQLLLRSLHAAGVNTIFDTNYRARLWDSRTMARQCIADALSHTHMALVTFDDEQQLWGDTCPEETGLRLHNHGVTTVVVKLGAEGAYWSDINGGEVFTGFVPAQRVINVCDTTAAGDAFNAGILAAIGRGASLPSACEFAHQVAAVVIQHPGALIPADVFTADYDRFAAQ